MSVSLQVWASYIWLKNYETFWGGYLFQDCRSGVGAYSNFYGMILTKTSNASMLNMWAYVLVLFTDFS